MPLLSAGRRSNHLVQNRISWHRRIAWVLVLPKASRWRFSQPYRRIADFSSELPDSETPRSESNPSARYDNALSSRRIFMTTSLTAFVAFSRPIQFNIGMSICPPNTLPPQRTHSAAAAIAAHARCLVPLLAWFTPHSILNIAASVFQQLLITVCRHLGLPSIHNSLSSRQSKSSPSKICHSYAQIHRTIFRRQATELWAFSRSPRTNR